MKKRKNVWPKSLQIIVDGLRSNQIFTVHDRRFRETEKMKKKAWKSIRGYCLEFFLKLACALVKFIAKICCLSSFSKNNNSSHVVAWLLEAKCFNLTVFSNLNVWLNYLRDLYRTRICKNVYDFEGENILGSKFLFLCRIEIKY